MTKKEEVLTRDISYSRVYEISNDDDTLNYEAIYLQIVRDDKTIDLYFGNDTTVYLVAEMPELNIVDLANHLMQELGYAHDKQSLFGNYFTNSKGHIVILDVRAVFMTHIVPGLICTLVNHCASKQYLVIQGIRKCPTIDILPV